MRETRNCRPDQELFGEDTGCFASTDTRERPVMGSRDGGCWRPLGLVFSASVSRGCSRPKHVRRSRWPRAKAVIFINLFGGPSQLETFDLKPDAPEKIRGPFRPIDCRTPGLLIGEHLPGLAAGLRQVLRRADDDAPVQRPQRRGATTSRPARSGKSRSAAASTPLPATGRPWDRSSNTCDQHAARSGIGAVDLPRLRCACRIRWDGSRKSGQYLRPGEHAGWLGRRYNPLTTVVDKKDLNDNPYWRDCRDEELTFQIEGLAAGRGAASWTG